jgi:hypothetical protein
MNRIAGIAACTGGGAVPTVGDLFILDDGSCILLSYQATWAGMTQQVVFGYRLANGTLQMLQDPTGLLRTTNPGSCNANNLNGATWIDLTSQNETLVEVLRFSTLGSRCVNNRTGVQWVVTAPQAVAPACDPTTANYAAAAGDTLVESRIIRIGVSATHLMDDQIRFGRLDQAGAPIHRVDVKVRNNRIIDVGHDGVRHGKSRNPHIGVWSGSTGPATGCRHPCHRDHPLGWDLADGPLWLQGRPP